MDDDDLPSAAPAPPEQPPFPAFGPGWGAAPAAEAAAAADPKLGFLGAKMDDCDVWDGVPEGEDEEAGKVEIGAAAGEEDDLMLDMLRSQQDGQFIIGGEDVLAGAGLVPEFAVGEGGGGAAMGVEIGGVAEGALESAGLEGEAAEPGVCGIAEVCLPVEGGTEIVVGAGEEGGEGAIGGEVQVAEADMVVDGDAAGADGADNPGAEDCREDDCAGDTVEREQGVEVGVGIEVQGAVSSSQIAVPGGEEAGLVEASSPQGGEAVAIVQTSPPQVDGEVGGGEPPLLEAAPSAQGCEEVGQEDASLLQGDKEVGGMAVEAMDTTESGKEMVHVIDDSQLLDATMPAVEAIGQEDGTPSALAVGAEAMAAEVSQTDANSSGSVPTKGPGRRKRGRQPKAQVPKAFKKKGEEDVCFICFDGGDLVVCDRRGCPKVYHPSCVNRDEAFFRAKGRWNCGWHICSVCEKAAQYMCYTCTYSLCKGCIKETEFFCIRGNKGLCVTCKGMVMLIETKDPAAVNFYDKSSWEHLFKDYWTDVKEKLSITYDEITKGKRPSKKAVVRNEESSDEVYEANEGAASSSDSSSGRGSSTKNKKRAKRRKAVTSNEESSVTVVDSAGSSAPGDGDWASKELLEFVSHMKDGDSSVLSQFDVQALLLEYIKRNKLRDPRRKSQIICDSRLENLFGKARVGHFEMLKLLESHFLIKEASHFAADDDQMATGDPDSSRMDAEGCSDAAKMIPEKRRKGRKKEDRESQTNFDDYAAINAHNISLVYLRRNLMEDLIDDTENFNGKVVGSFVRIRITASGQRQDMYRLVKVIGTTKAPEKYQSGKKTTDILLEILNLNKTEVMSIDTISNQEFTEEECKRLRQSIKIGFIPRMTVGELREKARDLQTIKVNDWLETEKARLSHLRDRASETGRRKELRECVEKLEMLPEEHLRKLSEIPDVHSDPNMDPNYVSAEEENDDKKQDGTHNRQRGSGYYRKGKDAGSSDKGGVPIDWSGPRKNEGDGVGASDSMHGSSWGRSKDVPQQNSSEMQSNRGVTTQNASQSLQAAGQAHLSANTSASTTPSLLPKTTATTGSSINESEKVWHYQDPTAKIQGPFSMVQLRKWNSTGYFPRDLRIWKASEKQEDSILLSDALIGKFDKELPAWGSQQQSGFQSSNPPKVMDSRDINRNRLGQSDHEQIKSDGWSAGTKMANASNSTVPSIVGTAGVQDYAVTWNSGRPTAFPSNGPSYDRHSQTTGSSFQQLPVQQANFQPVAFGTNPGTGLNRPPANMNSPTTNSNVAGSSRGSQPRVRVSRWEPEAVPTFVHGAQLNNEVPRKGEPTVPSGNVAALLPPMDSPTPKSEQLTGFSVAKDLQKNSSSISDPLSLQGLSKLDSGASIANNAGVPGHDKSTRETMSQHRELHNADSFSRDQISEKNFSPIRTEGSGVSIVKPLIAPVDVKNSNWSMPSPTPSSELAQMDVGAQVTPVNNTPVFSDGNRLQASVQINSDPSVGPAPQTMTPQTPGLLVNQNPGWGFAPDNSAPGVIPTQAGAGWSTQLPPNANVAWVATGAPNVGWTPMPQGNANVVGWGPAAAGAQIVNNVPQVAGTGTMPPVAGWGPVAQVVPQAANASWGAAIPPANVNPGWGAAVQGFPNANPGWVVPQPANTTDQNMGWVAPIPGNPNANVGWGVTNGSPNAGWNSPSGNPNNWGSHQREQDRYNRNQNNGDSGHGGGRHRMHSSGGSSWDPNGPRGICRFHENGHCKKGASCNFLHT